MKIIRTWWNTRFQLWIIENNKKKRRRVFLLIIKLKSECGPRNFKMRQEIYQILLQQWERAEKCVKSDQKFVIIFPHLVPLFLLVLYSDTESQINVKFLQQWEWEKRSYNQRVIYVEHGSCSALVFSPYRWQRSGMIYWTRALKLYEKKRMKYSIDRESFAKLKEIFHL